MEIYKYIAGCNTTLFEGNVFLFPFSRNQALLLLLLLLPYTGLGPFQALKVQSKLVCLGGGGAVCAFLNS